MQILAEKGLMMMMMGSQLVYLVKPKYKSEQHGGETFWGKKIKLLV